MNWKKTHYETSEESYEDNMDKRIMPRRIMEQFNPPERYIKRRKKRMTGKYHEQREKKNRSLCEVRVLYIYMMREEEKTKRKENVSHPNKSSVEIDSFFPY